MPVGPLSNPMMQPSISTSSWDSQEILDACERSLLGREAELHLDQSPQGLDALDEVDVHPLLAAGLQAVGWGVVREQPLPGGVSKSPGLPKHAQRERCDLVLLPSPRHVLLDWVRESRERTKWQGSLFESVPTPPPLPDRALCVDARDAFWLEVKVVAQHAFIDGVPRPNGAWGAQLVASLTQDLAKLAAQTSAPHDDAVHNGKPLESRALATSGGSIIEPKPGLSHAGLLLVIFAETPDVIAHDLPIALHRALDKGATFRSPIHATRRDMAVPPGFAISDRIGNAWCQCVLVPAN